MISSTELQRIRQEFLDKEALEIPGILEEIERKIIQKSKEGQISMMVTERFKKLQPENKREIEKILNAAGIREFTTDFFSWH